MSTKAISQLKDRVNTYIPLFNGLFISKEAASSEREFIKSLLNNINRDYNYVKISVHMDKDLGTQIIEISCVRVVGLCIMHIFVF